MDATNDLYQQLQNEKLNIQEFNSNANQYIGSIIENSNSTVFKLQQMSIQCLQLLYENYFNQISELSFDFTYGNIIKSCINNFKNAKQDFRDLNLNCVSQILTQVDCSSQIIQEVKNCLKNKNGLQKQYSIKLLEITCDKCDEQQLQQIRELIQIFKQDNNQEVRKECDILQQIIENTDPVTKSARITTRQSTIMNKSILQQQRPLYVKNAQQRQQKSNSDSLFPTPNDNDPQAQDQPFSIVPSLPTSYLPYKPTEQFDITLSKILQQGDKLLYELYEIINNEDVQQVQQILNKLNSQIVKGLNSSDWQTQMQAIQTVFKISLIDNQCQNLNINNIVAKQINQWLLENKISDMYSSLRSTLSREALIIIELLIQRYGSKLQQFINANSIQLIQLINKKGVYFQCQSLSLLKTLIINQDPQYNKQLFVQLLQQYRLTKVPQTKSYILDLILMIVIVNASLPIFEPLASNELKSIIQSAIKDANGQLRHTTRVFVNVCNQLYEYDGVIQGKDAEMLQDQKYMQCGYHTYQGDILIDIQDQDFIQLYMKSGSCNQQINIVFTQQLPRYRESMIYSNDFDIQPSNMEQFGLLINQSEWEQDVKKRCQNLDFNAQTPIKHNKTPQIPSQSVKQTSNLEIFTSFQNKKKNKNFDDFQVSNDDDEITNTVKDTILQIQSPDIQNLMKLFDIPNDTKKLKEFLIYDKLNETQIYDILMNLLKSLQFVQKIEFLRQLLDLLMQIILIDQNFTSEMIQRVLMCLIQLLQHKDQQVKQQADQILKLIIQTFNKINVINSLIQIFQSLKNQQTQNLNICMKLIGIQIKQFDKESLLLYIKPIISDLVKLFDNKDISLRKTSVTLFIDFYLILNEKFLPYIDQLTDRQLLLVIERIKKMKQKSQIQ